jgi:hypothetical protein
MRLHTQIKQGNVGIVASKPSWHLNFRLELTTEEAQLVNTYRLGGRWLGSYVADGGTEGETTVMEAVNNRRDYCFSDLVRVLAFKASMVEGCKGLRDYLRPMQALTFLAEQEEPRILGTIGLPDSLFGAAVVV